MKTSISRITTGLTILVVASCAKHRTFTFVNGQPVQPFDQPIVELLDRDQLDEPVQGHEQTLAWRELAEFPLAADDGGLALRFPSGMTAFLNLRSTEELRAPTRATAADHQDILQVERQIGTATMTVISRDSGDLAQGTLTLRYNEVNLAELRRVGWNPTGRQCLQLLINDTATAEIAAYKRAAPDCSLHLATMLFERDVAIDGYAQFAAATDFDDADVIRMLQHGIDLQTPVAWQKLGKNLTADEIIYCRQRGFGPPLAGEWQSVDADLSIKQIYWAKARGVAPQDHRAWLEVGNRLSLEDLYWVRARGVQPRSFRQWREAGFELDHEQLYWAKARGLDPETWRMWHEAGRSLDLDELYQARAHGLKPAESRAWHDAGHELSIDQLRTARTRGLRASVAAEWREQGFTWTLKQLGQLRVRGITPQFAMQFVDPSYENPTFDDLARYHKLGLKPDDVNKLRQRRNNG